MQTICLSLTNQEFDAIASKAASVGLEPNTLIVAFLRHQNYFKIEPQQRTESVQPQNAKISHKFALFVTAIEQLEITQNQIAAFFKVAQPTVSKAFNGMSNIVSKKIESCKNPEELAKQIWIHGMESLFETVNIFSYFDDKSVFNKASQDEKYIAQIFASYCYLYADKVRNIRFNTSVFFSKLEKFWEKNDIREDTDFGTLASDAALMHDFCVENASFLF